MRDIRLHDARRHRFLLLNESEPGAEDGFRSNQYLLQYGEHGILLDLGGFGLMPRVPAEMMRCLDPDKLQAIILSHQDPDIVGSLST